MVAFSQRKYNYQINADILHLLNDPLGLLPYEELERRFINTKESILDYITRNHNDPYFDEIRRRRLLNIGIFNDNRPVIEFRWFGSTQNIIELMSMIEWSFAMPTWCKTVQSIEEISLRNFMSFIKKAPDKYHNLLEIAQRTTLSREYAILGVKERKPPRRVDTISSVA